MHFIAFSLRQATEGLLRNRVMTLAATVTAGEYAFSCSITDGTAGTKTLTATYSGATAFLTSNASRSE